MMCGHGARSRHSRTSRSVWRASQMSLAYGLIRLMATRRPRSFFAAHTTPNDPLPTTCVALYLCAPERRWKDSIVGFCGWVSELCCRGRRDADAGYAETGAGARKKSQTIVRHAGDLVHGPL